MSIEETIDAVHLTARAITKTYTAALSLAAGSSTRMGGINKQMETLCDIPVLAHTLMAYQKCPLIAEIVVVTRAQDVDTVRSLAQEYGIAKLTHVVTGGSSRQESAANGMRVLDERVKYVAIADGARCLITPMQIARVCIHAYRYRAASAAHKVSDTVKRANKMGMTKETVDRTDLWQAQTPQIFHVALYKAALYRAKHDEFTATDDNALIEHMGYQVSLVECGTQNIKITTPEDLPLAEAILTYRRQKHDS